MYIPAILPAASALVFLNIFMDNIAGHIKLYDPNNIAKDIWSNDIFSQNPDLD